MRQHILHVSLLVRSYDEAIDFYTRKLRFELVEDTRLSPDKRWVVIKPSGDAAMSLVLAEAKTAEEIRQIGNQCGGRVFLFLSTDDFQRDYQQMLADGIEFVREPEAHEYGTVAVFKDLYGNLWDLLQPGPAHAMYTRLTTDSVVS